MTDDRAKVLLIGGAPGAGKTTLGAALAVELAEHRRPDDGSTGRRVRVVTQDGTRSVQELCADVLRSDAR